MAREKNTDKKLIPFLSYYKPNANIMREFAQKLKATGNTFDGQREIVQGFLSSLFQRIPDNTSTISTMLNGPLGESLDPVGYNGSKAINEAGDICMDEVEDLFSHSVSLGVKKINRYLVGPEKILFNFLGCAHCICHG